MSFLVPWAPPFQVITADVRELDASSAPHLDPIQLAIENAELKAQAIALQHPHRWILGADTVVELAGHVFGKPASLEQAREFLRELSGRTHRVITGGVLWGPAGEKHLFHDSSSVTFLPLSDEVIDRYLKIVPVLDKAGAYALQDHGEWIISSVEGSRSNIIGLPTEKLTELFRHCGLL